MEQSKNILLYVGTPYTHADPAVMTARFHLVNRLAVKLMNDGFLVYSPITHGHPLALCGDLPRDWTYWERLATHMLGLCNALVVLKIDGWQESRGLTEEIQIAKKLGMPILYMEAV